LNKNNLYKIDYKYINKKRTIDLLTPIALFTLLIINYPLWLWTRQL